MISSRTINNVARHFEEQIYELDRKMIGSSAVSPFAQHIRQAMAQAAEMLRLEAVRIDAGHDLVVGPDMFKDRPQDPLFGMEGPEDEV
jgi:hypothetical protein